MMMAFQIVASALSAWVFLYVVAVDLDNPWARTWVALAVGYGGGYLATVLVEKCRSAWLALRRGKAPAPLWTPPPDA